MQIARVLPHPQPSSSATSMARPRGINDAPMPTTFLDQPIVQIQQLANRLKRRRTGDIDICASNQKLVYGASVIDLAAQRLFNFH